ncbi:glycoside hydrolase superfamily [Jimgerdemannia flammicorona]|uniref:cellulase n=1 Tax=Jimgerdemannia flammicorona TaxID=994334 RepID=A0A433B9X8_9FUNG|nr:glycoside hydrolase superfamily [Jimgerdemannia flammicorona]
MRVLSLLLAVVTFTSSATAIVRWAGVNEAGGDFGSKGGVYGTDYTYPTKSSVNYFASKKVNVIRVPFLWERLQPNLNQALNATEFGRLNAIVNYATKTKGIYVLLDPHNYARYNGQLIGSSAVPYNSFKKFWRLLATKYKSNGKIIFGLMNEPNTMPTEQVLTAMQAGVDGIRSTNATQLILVPGNAWTGAHSWTQSWYGTSNAQVMLNIKDPHNNYAYDMHQYLDSDYSGTSSSCNSPTVGSDQLATATAWLKTNKKRAFLSEFGFGANPTCYAAANNLLAYLNANHVWIGYTYWASGPMWGNYIYSVEPKQGGDAPQMTHALNKWLRKHK